MTIAGLIVVFGYVWLGLGGLTALVFLTFGIDRVVEDAREVYLFRVLAVPGVMLLWPLVLWRWRRKERDELKWRDHHSPNRRLASWLECSMALALIAVLYLAATIGPDPSQFPEHQKLGLWIEFRGALA